jgi:hypothetical protein
MAFTDSYRNMMEDPLYWMRRPLTPEHVEFASRDVQYFFAIFEKMSAQLDDTYLGRRWITRPADTSCTWSAHVRACVCVCVRVADPP